MTAIYIIAGYLLVASLIGLIPATLARSKGRSFAAWWAVSVLALGIFTVTPVMMLKTYRCPECREVVSPGARVCWRCHTVLSQPSEVPSLRRITPAEALADLQLTLWFTFAGVIVTGLTMWAGVAAFSTWRALAFCAALGVIAAAMLTIGIWPAVRQYRQFGSTE